MSKDIERIKEGVIQGKKITLTIYILRDSTEVRLQKIIQMLLERYKRLDLLEVFYTCTKELVINATKANLKRVLFTESGCDPIEFENYQKMMEGFRDKLIEKKLETYEKKMKECKLPIHVSFEHNPQRIIIQVRNHFTLYPQEEKRIREKADKSKNFDNLIDFYMEQSDETEGAGMGITLITILLKQAGTDPHCFTIHSNDSKQTIAKIELPLDPQYVPTRIQNERLLLEGKTTLEKLRKNHFNISANADN